MSKDTPSPPDPAATAQAQAAANVGAVRESALVNQINQITPFGSETFTGTIGTPDRTRVVALDPADAANLETQRRIGAGLFGLGEGALLPQVQGALGSELDFSGLPQISGAGDLAGQAQGLEQATFQRGLNLLQPGIDQQQRALEVQLANQGIPRGSDAFDEAVGNFERNRGQQLENLALSSVGAGRAEQSRLFGLEQAARQQGLSELLTQRSQPINELSALLQGGPSIQRPQFAPPAQFGVAPPDVQGLTGQNFAAQSQQAAQRNSDLFGGLFGLGQAAILGGFG
ncbi:MAG: hypothetical protein ACR2RF_26375 [Geminicoccaceae bacterium]